MGFMNKGLIFFVPVFILFLPACNNRAADNVMRDFDSVNQSLRRTNNSLEQSANELYQQLEQQWAGTSKAGSLQQLQYHVQDFYGYLSDLKLRFYRACGDSTGASMPPGSEDDPLITNNFFGPDGPAASLPVQLQQVQTMLMKHTSDSLLVNRIRQLTSYPGEERNAGFNKGWFYNVPPVAAVTLLHKFGNDVYLLEAAILKSFLGQQ